MKKTIWGILLTVALGLSGCGGAFQWAGKAVSELTPEEKAEAILTSLDVGFRGALWGIKTKNPDLAAKVFKYGETIFTAMKAISGEEVTAKHLADIVEITVSQADPEAGKQIRQIVLVMTPVLRKLSYKLPTGENGYRVEIIHQIADNGLAAIQDFKGA